MVKQSGMLEYMNKNYITFQSVLLPMNFWDLMNSEITPEQAFDIGIINPKPNGQV